MDSYSVSLDVFCGPLDLLLQLIRRDEIEVTNISLAKVADQFVEYLRAVEFSDLEIAADFIVVACHLMEIKSRELLPEEDQGVEAEEIVDFDRGSDLIQKLLEYRAFKDLARQLRSLTQGASRRHARGAVPDLPQIPVDLDAVLAGVSVWDLVSSFAKIAKEILLEPRTTIVYDDIPIGEHIDRILEFLRSQGDGEFSMVLGSKGGKSRVIGAFLALLELVQQKLVRIHQEEDFSEIFLTKSEPPADFDEVEEEDDLVPPSSPPPAEGPGNAGPEDPEESVSPGEELPPVPGPTGETPIAGTPVKPSPSEDDVDIPPARG